MANILSYMLLTICYARLPPLADSAACGDQELNREPIILVMKFYIYFQEPKYTFSTLVVLFFSPSKPNLHESLKTQ
jgi:hypothetical protein